MNENSADEPDFDSTAEAIDRLQEITEEVTRLNEAIEKTIGEPPETKETVLDMAAPDHSDYDDLPDAPPEEIAALKTPTLITTEKQYQQWQDGTLTREDLGAFPEDKITSIPRKTGIIVDLFTPPSRAMLLDTWANFGSQLVTVKEIVDECTLSRQAAYKQTNELVEQGIIVETDEMKGNATGHRLNVRHPAVQLFTMLNNVGSRGRTPLLLEREYLTPHPDGDDHPTVEKGSAETPDADGEQQ